MPKKAKKTKKQRKAVKPVVLANNVSPRPVVAKAPKGKKRAPGNMVRHVRGICSVTDPFCPASKGSKWPDGTAGNTLTEQFRGTVNIGTDAAGYACFNFAAAAPFGYNFATIVGTAPPVATFGANYSTYRSSSLLATYGSLYRVVSAGVVVRCIASATTASGVVTFGVAQPAAVSSAMNMGQELYQECSVKAIQPGMEFSWISANKGSGSHDFIAQSTSTSVTNDWSSLYVEVSGAPVSTNVLMAEWFVNVEFEPLTTNRALSAVAKPNPPASSAAVATVSSVHNSLGSFIEGGVKQVEDAVFDHASKALSSLLDNPFDALAALFPF